MKHRFQVCIMWVISLLLLVSLPLCATAAESNTGSLLVKFKQPNVTFQLYFAAAQSEEGYQPTEAFKNCSVDFKDAGAGDLRALATTLYACTIRDQIPFDLEQMTDETGSVLFTGLQPGIYLLTSTGNATPIVAEVSSGKTVAVQPKTEPAPGDKPVSIRVSKVWKDQGFESKRTKTISVQLYQGTRLYSTVALSAENDWSYVWRELPGGYNYSVIEKSVPEHYKMCITQDENSFILQNTYENPNTPSPPDDKPTTPTLPNTGLLRWPIIPLALCGVIAIGVGAILCRRKDKDEQP